MQNLCKKKITHISIIQSFACTHTECDILCFRLYTCQTMLQEESFISATIKNWFVTSFPFADKKNWFICKRKHFFLTTFHALTSRCEETCRWKPVRAVRKLSANGPHYEKVPSAVKVQPQSRRWKKWEIKVMKCKRRGWNLITAKSKGGFKTKICKNELSEYTPELQTWCRWKCSNETEACV